MPAHAPPTRRPPLKRRKARRTYKKRDQTPILEYGLYKDLGGYHDCHLVHESMRGRFPPALVDHIIEKVKGLRGIPNPFNNKTFLKRKQCCFTKGQQTYSFGQSNPVMGDVHNPPDGFKLVTLCARLAAQLVYEKKLPGVPDGVSTLTEDEIYEAVVCVQVNGYQGNAQLGSHQDNEHIHSPGAPIVGFSFYDAEHRDGTHGRRFFVSEDKECNRVLGSVFTGHGDMIAMCGRFQKHLYHSVPAECARLAREIETMYRVSVSVRFNFE